VQAGHDVTLMPLSGCQEEVNSGSLRIVKVASLRGELLVLVVRRREGYVSRAAETFLQVLRRYYRPGSATPGLDGLARSIGLGFGWHA
jgi:hypothetical protein